MKKIHSAGEEIRKLTNGLRIACTAVFVGVLVLAAGATTAVAQECGNLKCEKGESPRGAPPCPALFVCSCPEDCPDLTAFVDELLPGDGIPTVLRPVEVTEDGEPFYRIKIQEVRQKLHRDLPETVVWGFNGMVPGPTIEVPRVGQPIVVEYINDLRVTDPLDINYGQFRTSHYLPLNQANHGPSFWRDAPRVVVHLHGEKVPPRFDGHPEYTILPGQSDVYHYPNDQRSMTMWYHDHALGITNFNLYMGLAGFYLLKGRRELELDLPRGEFEIPLMIRQAGFHGDGLLRVDGSSERNDFTPRNDYFLVNGKVTPYLNVKRGKYRFRLLNANQGETLALTLVDRDTLEKIPFTLIGTDGGLIDSPFTISTNYQTPSPFTSRPVPRGSIIMGVAERLDVVIDFADLGGKHIRLMHNKDCTINDGTPLCTEVDVMEFRVESEECQDCYTRALPENLGVVEPIERDQVTRTRRFRLAVVCEDAGGNRVDCSNPNKVRTSFVIRSLGLVLPENRHCEAIPFFFDSCERFDHLSEFPVLGTTEVWEFEDAADGPHPIHLHLVNFQILEKRDAGGNLILPLPPWEANTWKDTVLVPKGGKTKVIMRFIGGYLGRFTDHCHILVHEDDEMMRQFQTVNRAESCDNNGTCEPGEDSVSCPNDCKEVSGDYCGNFLCEQGDGESDSTCPGDCSDPVVLPSGQSLTPPFVRTSPRLRASCGDGLCEGQEQVNNPDTFCEVDCGSPCLRNPPTLTIFPDQAIAPDGEARYLLTITNNNSGSCRPPSTFSLRLVDFDPDTPDLEESNNPGAFVLPSVLSSTLETLDPGATVSRGLLIVKGSGTGLEGDVLLTAVEVRDNVSGMTSIDTARTRLSFSTRSGLRLDADASFLLEPSEFFSSGPTDVAVADLDGDGNQDLAVTNGVSNTVSVLLGDGTGSFSQPAPESPVTGGETPVRIVVGDFNQDRNLDLAIANSTSRNVSVLAGNGNGSFQPAIVFPVNGHPVSLAAGDFNEDGKLDLAVAVAGSGDSGSLDKGNLTLLFGTGTPLVFGSPTERQVGDNPVWVGKDDFNKDGHVDLAVVNQLSHDVLILLGNGDGTFLESGPFLLPGSPTYGAIGDLNHDGNPDLVVAGFFKRLLPPRAAEFFLDVVFVLLGDGSGSFIRPFPSSPNLFTIIPIEDRSVPNALAIGDLDLDGHPDLAVVSRNRTISALLGDGTGSFSIYRRATSLTNPRGVAIMDLNGNCRRQGRDRIAPEVVTAGDIAPGASSVVKVFFNETVAFPAITSCLTGNQRDVTSGTVSPDQYLGLIP